MFYRPTKVAKMWDTWLYHHKGVHYLYYLHETTGERFDGMSLATSTDGVHWEEIGSIIEKDDDAEWLGTGSVWRAGDQFVTNYSEQRDGVQAVFFAVSEDLVHWQKLGDEYRCDADPEWYDDTPTGRWDCIWSVQREEGGYVGYLTARPWSKESGRHYESVGKVASEDGLHWHAVDPPLIEWGESPKMDVGEVGAIERVGSKYYMILGYGESSLGNRFASDVDYGRGGMHTFVGDSPDGPFKVDAGAYRLLTSPAGRRSMAYFCRFYPTPEGMLVTHHSISRDDVRWMPPLKRAIVDGQGDLHLGYWEGNEAAKGKEFPIDMARIARVGARRNDPDIDAAPHRLQVNQTHGGGLALLDEAFDLSTGLILEGELSIEDAGNDWAGAGVYIQEEAEGERGTAFVAQTRGRTEIGRLSDGRSFVPDDSLPIGLVSGRTARLRLLVRASLAELYLDDRLVQCYSLPGVGTGRIGLVWEAGHVSFDRMRCWEMDL